MVFVVLYRLVHTIGKITWKVFQRFFFPPPRVIFNFVLKYSFLSPQMEFHQFKWVNRTTKREVVCEPRRGDELQNLLANSYRRIDETSLTVPDGQRVARCRGKVGEGLDFVDKNAWIVITVSLYVAFFPGTMGNKTPDDLDFGLAVDKLKRNWLFQNFDVRRLASWSLLFSNSVTSSLYLTKSLFCNNFRRGVSSLSSFNIGDNIIFFILYVLIKI